MATDQQARWVFLSHSLDAATPAYGGAAGAAISADKRMDRGNSCNTSRWALSNHLGTHLDFPRHFIANGATIDDYPAEFFVFRSVGVIELGAVAGGQVVDVEHLRPFSPPGDVEILLLKTGFGNRRSLDTYWSENPGYSPDLANYLRKTFPALRVLGFDSISLSSFLHRDLGREAHRRFLGHDRPILPLEDMNLEDVRTSSRFRQLILAPWRVRDADAAPCTVMAELLPR